MAWRSSPLKLLTLDQLLSLAKCGLCLPLLQSTWLLKSCSFLRRGTKVRLSQASIFSRRWKTGPSTCGLLGLSSSRYFLASPSGSVTKAWSLTSEASKCSTMASLACQAGTFRRLFWSKHKLSKTWELKSRSMTHMEWREMNDLWTY